MSPSGRGKHGAGSRAGEAGEAADAELFRRTMAGVEPLKKKRTLTTPATAELDAAKARPVIAAPRHPLTPPSPPARQPAPPPPLSAGAFAGVDRRTVERMRRGKLPIDARLDLHGRYQDAAQSELNAFIAGSAAAGRRLVLVITGKGALSEGGGVLRRRLPDWLNQPACRPHVLAFAPARPEHGGSGAFYVLLRRRREGRS